MAKKSEAQAVLDEFFSDDEETKPRRKKLSKVKVVEPEEDEEEEEEEEEEAPPKKKRRAVAEKVVRAATTTRRKVEIPSEDLKPKKVRKLRAQQALSEVSGKVAKLREKKAETKESRRGGTPRHEAYEVEVEANIEIPPKQKRRAFKRIPLELLKKVGQSFLLDDEELTASTVALQISLFKRDPDNEGIEFCYRTITDEGIRIWRTA